jgi:hypothetical protein
MNYSSDFRLFAYLDRLTPGVGVTMNELMGVADVIEPQTVRNSLTRLRKGEVPDPKVRGARLKPIPVRYNPSDRRYYNLARLSSDSIEAQIPGQILNSRVSDLITRAMTLDSAMGADGLVTATVMLKDSDIRSLLAQLPIRDLQRAQNVVTQLAMARNLIEIAALTEGVALVESDEDDPSRNSDGKGKENG